MARNRHAEKPIDIPGRGWKAVLLRVLGEIGRDNVALVAAGVAFFGILALFPAITALMALAGLMLEPGDVTDQMQYLAELMPPQAAEIVMNQAIGVAGSREGGLGLAFVAGLALALYSASNGMGSLISGLNIAYDEREKRGFFRLKLATLALTLLLILGLVVGLAGVMALPPLLAFLGLPVWLETTLSVLRWMVLAVLTITGLAAIYRWGPSRCNAQWAWLTPGAIVACALWLIGSVGLSVYLNNFGSYNETFGSMAGVIVLLLWLWLSAFVVLLGAELNAEMEAQTASDTTIGKDRPMGQRGAVKADMLAEQGS